MASSSKAEEIIAKASHWTFEDDNSVLVWMEAIGKNLEEHVIATNEKFKQLSTNFNTTSIELDNVSNSLSLLQYTNFVENRCLDDDDTLANVADVPKPKSNQNDQPEEMTTEEFQRKFLKKNLDIMRNYFEKCPINPQDSKEKNTTNDFIYKPKNPYNHRPLPHIYGTKLWKEQWHVGLLEDSSSSSDDQLSKGQKDTLSSRAQDKESLISTSANLSESVSTNINELRQKEQDNHHVQSKNASSLSPERSTASRGIAAGSDTRSTKASVKQFDNRYDLFASTQDSPPPISFPSSPAVPPKPPPPPPPQQQHQPFPSSIPTNTHEPPGEITKSPATITSDSDEVQRRPIKLYNNDNNFASLLSEIVEKANRKKTTLPSAAAVVHSNAPTGSSAKINTKEKETVEPSLNLFDDSENNTMVYAPKSSELAPTTSKSNKPPTLNLFDTSDSSPPKDDLFATVNALFDDSRKTQPLLKHQLSTKTIFDDDEDDEDDFLNIFATKNKNIPKSFGKTLLFDDDDWETDDKDYNERERKISNRTEDIQEVDKNRSFSEDGAWGTSNKIILPKVDLFGDLNEEENIFDQQQKVHNQEPTSVDQKTLVGKKQVKSTSDIIVGEDKDNDLFQSLNKRVEGGSLSSPVHKSLTEYDDDLFTSKQHDKKADERIIEQKADVLLDDKISKSNKELHDTNLKEKSHGNSQHTESLSQQLLNTETIPISSSADINSHPEDARRDENFTAASSTNDKITNSNPNVNSHDVSNSFKTSDRPSDGAENKKNNMLSIVEKSSLNKYSSLFLEDEPPEDDDAFFQTLDSSAIAKSMAHDVEHEFYKSAQTTTDSSATSGLYASSAYGNLGLYSEIPPEDDDDGSFQQNVISSTSSQSNEPKRSIFYHDFDETIAAVNTQKTFESTGTVHGIFYDEPPLDDFQVLIRNTAKNEQTVDNFGDEEVKIPLSHEDLANILGSHTFVETEKPAAVYDKSTIKSFENTEISKLDTSKLPTINVKALLPTAVAPKQQQMAARIEQIRTSQEDVSLITDSNSTDYPFNKNPANPKDNLLVNACKDRVRASSKRRPSTRRARQENYRKSLLSEQPEELVAKLEHEAGRQKLIEGESLEEARKAAAEFKSSERSKSKQEHQYDTNNTADQVKKQDFGETDNANQRSMFANNFSIKESQSISFPNSNTKPKTNTSSGSLFDEDDDMNDLFSPHKKKRNSQDTFISSEATVRATAVVTKSIASEADSKKYKNPSDEINSIKSTSRSENKNFPVVPSNLYSKSQENESKKASSNLFGDDDDDDDLFGGFLSKRTNNSIQASSKISEATNVPTTAAAAALIAIKKSSTAEDVQQSMLFTSTKVKSLFESDEDEGDDGMAFLKTTQPQATQKFRSLQKTPSKPVDKTVLFSDTDDDDEDLFSSISSKAARGTVSSVDPIVSQTNKPTATKTTKTKSTTTNPDNPLADLLNN